MRRPADRRPDAGGAFIEIYVIVVVLGIVAALVIPRYVKVRAERGQNGCARVIDGQVDVLAAGTARAGVGGACPITGVALVVSSNGTGHRVCCPNPFKHKVESEDALCRVAGSPALVKAFPEPGVWRERIWMVLTWGFTLLFVVSALAVMILGRRHRGF